MSLAVAPSPAGGVAVPPNVAPVLEKFCFKYHKGEDAEGNGTLNIWPRWGGGRFSMS